MQRILQGLVPLIEAEQWDEALLALEPVAVVWIQVLQVLTDLQNVLLSGIYILF